jgi:hypothetical protein
MTDSENGCGDVGARQRVVQHGHGSYHPSSNLCGLAARITVSEYYLYVGNRGQRQNDSMGGW